MLSTLQTYECMFGPYSLQTLALAVQIAPRLLAAGDRGSAMVFLESAAKNLARFREGALPVRLRALELLRDELLDDGELRAAIAIQQELVACRRRSCGADSPVFLAEQASLVRMLMREVRTAEPVLA